MITVKYEKYYNDYRNTQETKNFSSLEEVADWLFGMVQGEYKRSMRFINPDDDHMVEGKLCLNRSYIESRDGTYVYWVEQIEKDGMIIYSCGTFTNRICHWNEEVKQWLRECRTRRNNPQFIFG